MYQHLVESFWGYTANLFYLAALINANNELLSCFKSYDEMLEQQSVNQATVNSQSLHNRTTRNVSLK
jgi:hypothetical protein